MGKDVKNFKFEIIKKLYVIILLRIMMNFNGFNTERLFTGRGELTKPETHQYADDESPDNS